MSGDYFNCYISKQLRGEDKGGCYWQLLDAKHFIFHGTALRAATSDPTGKEH